MNIKKFLAFLAVVIVLAAIAGFAYTQYKGKAFAPASLTGQTATPSMQQQTAKSTTATITTTTKTINDNSASLKYKIAVSYPQVSGLKNAQTQTAINTAIEQQMQKDIAAFKKEVATTEQNTNLPSSFQNFINEFTVTPTVTQASNKIISVQFAVMDSQAGAAHPNNYNEVFNYDVANNKQLMLADVFKPGSNYVQTISDLAQKDLQKKFASDPNAADFIKTGAGPDAKNFRLFVLKPQSLMVIFDPAQVAANFAGTQTVDIPFSSLQSILNPAITAK